MIRRAQAEALLKLAEALEECERNEVTLVAPRGHWMELRHSGYTDAYISDMSSVDLRVLVSKLYPKSEAAE
ncbi:hypothetical protein D3C77_575340 [compost metagenome]